MSEPTANELALTELVTSAKRGDHAAWEALVRRYQPLIDSVTQRFRLSGPDAQDVAQTVWLKLFSNLHRLREPRALPGWIETTTINSCLTLLKVLRRTVLQDPQLSDDADTVRLLQEPRHQDELDEALLRHERRRAVRRGLAELPCEQQELLLLLTADPPLSYKQISERLGIPTGSIGPTRARALEKLRGTSPVRSLLHDGEDSALAA